MPVDKDVEKYLKSRITRDDYRGVHLAQHNRLPEDKLVALLKAVHDAVGEREFEIPPGDEPFPSRSHDPKAARKVSGFKDYYLILDNIAFCPDRGVSATFNSLKKNHFPNFHGMGLLIRSDDGRLGKLSKLAIEIIDAGPSRRRNVLIGQAMERLIGQSFADDLHELLRKIDQLNVWEMMLFISDTSTSIEDRERLVKNYRRMRAIQRLELHEHIQAICEPTMSHSDKVSRRDWHNWWNQAKQIVSMLAFVPGFMVVDEDHLMLVGGPGLPFFERVRSAQVKREALEWHNLSPREGWELHHIYPIEYATSANELSLLDSKENLLFIPATRHRQIPNRKNRSVQFAFNSQHVYLRNPVSSSGEPVHSFSISIDVEVRIDLLPQMVAYNKKLLDSVG